MRKVDIAVSDSNITHEAYAWSGDIAQGVAMQWDALVQRDPLAAPHRYRAWSEMLRREGVITPWRILVIYRSGQPIALFPLVRFRPRGARIVDDLSEFAAPLLIAEGEEAPAIAELARWFRRESSLCFLSLGRCANARYREQLHEIFIKGGAIPLHRPLPALVRIPVPASWDAYLAGLGASTRSKLKQLEPHLVRDYPSARLEWISRQSSEQACRESLAALMQLHQRRWQQHWTGSIFANEKNARFFLALMRWALAQDTAVLLQLRLGQTIVAVASILHVPGQPTGYCHYLARDPGAIPARYGTGKLLACQAIRWAIQRNMRELDLAEGNTDYKVQLGGIAYELHELLYVRTPALSIFAPQYPLLHEVLNNPLPLTLRHIGYKLTCRDDMA